MSAASVAQLLDGYNKAIGVKTASTTTGTDIQAHIIPVSATR
jgi:hypothetical protein